MMDKSELADLARKVADDRDREAFALLYDFFAPRVNGYLQRIGTAAGEAEELTQEVMIVLWHKAALFDRAKSSLATWLFRIARNRRIDSMRRDRSHLLDPDDPILHPEAAEAQDVTLDAARREERIRIAMRELPGEQLDLVLQAFFLGRTHSEIAVETGIPLGTVKSRIRLAFARLRRTIEEDPEVDVER